MSDIDNDRQGVALSDEPNGTGFSCAKRADDPSNEFAACGRWCENSSTCPSTASHASPGFDFKKFYRYVDILSDMSEEERDSAGSGVYPLSPELNTAVHAVNQTETRVRIRFNRYMNNPKGCFCGGTGCENCVVSSSRTEMPDIKGMVDRFLGWKLPRDFSPDCGISFTPPANPECGPVGTNLLNADQARQMFEHVLAAAEAPKP